VLRDDGSGPGRTQRRAVVPAATSPSVARRVSAAITDPCASQLEGTKVAPGSRPYSCPSHQGLGPQAEIRPGRVPAAEHHRAVRQQPEVLPRGGLPGTRPCITSAW
jgi:hypothetical protein